ncbi:MAG: hypothetical protein GY847_27790 [Proteobacteria bacterium]|nr:hypothetical protein [Pseudomonadota bacterium]
MMADEKKLDQAYSESAVQGELAQRLSWAPIRVLSIVTGVFLVRGIISLILRYCLALKRRVTVDVQGSFLLLDVEWSILGKCFRRVRTEAPIGDVPAMQLENRQRYLYLLVGSGALAIGAWLGIQWFVDGLRAGYPYLALLGAGVVVLGVLIDLGLYLFVPSGPGRSRLVLAMGPWKMRVTGIEPGAAEQFFKAVHAARENTSQLTR